MNESGNIYSNTIKTQRRVYNVTTDFVVLKRKHVPIESMLGENLLVVLERPLRGFQIRKSKLVRCTQKKVIGGL